MAKDPLMVDNTNDFMQMIRRKANRAVQDAADEHAVLWMDQLNREGPSVEGEVPARKTGKAFDSISIRENEEEASAASGSDFSKLGKDNYLIILEVLMERKGPAFVYTQNEPAIAARAKQGLEIQK